MKKFISGVTVGLILAVATNSFATNIGNTTNNEYNTTNNNPSAESDASAKANAAANATGYGVGIGGGAKVDVDNKINNTGTNKLENDINNLNSVTVKPEIDNKVSNDNRDTNIVANQSEVGVKTKVVTEDTNIVDNKAKSDQKQTQDQAQDNDQAITIEGDEYKAAKNPVASAIAPTVITANPCMGAASVGVSGQFFGLSGGKSMVDEQCNFRENVKLITAIAGQKAGVSMMCGNESFRPALGKQCPTVKADRVTVTFKPTEKLGTRKCQFPGESNCSK